LPLLPQKSPCTHGFISKRERQLQANSILAVGFVIQANKGGSVEQQIMSNQQNHNTTIIDIEVTPLVDSSEV